MIYCFLGLITFVLIINMSLLGFIVRKVKEVDNEDKRQDKDKTLD